MALHRAIFSVTGPTHLTHVVWESIHDQRVVAASLVQGSYNLEHDRLQHPQAETRLWWEHYGFQEDEKLVDQCNPSIFGAIYVNKHESERAPKYVVAIRGTVLKWETFERDLRLDLKIPTDKLDEDYRVQHVLEKVGEIVGEVGPEKVWLAGHSLGSAISMAVGKRMARRGTNIKTFLFNPPFPWRFPNLYSKNVVISRVTNGVLKVAFPIAEKVGYLKQKEFEDQFAELFSWTPYMFVNHGDIISSKYIHYFESREEKMRKKDLHSPWSFIKASFGKGSKLTLHILPRAQLTTRKTSRLQFLEAHGLKQWLGKEQIGYPVLVGESWERISDWYN